ncbi:cadmium resistance transporter [Enterococcus sp. ALS3]|uniref:Cadmium resistance transporter n=1 Tax=Enterococcus alishanensis TaxID=1303817 RepID=A0ABS6T9Q7_9ENTE|nr:cadmium resistance transporter [Enterococcus alishanensis]MBV7389636.1 cadmium resistance transporter [Enterococcus alishanensis]
MTALIITNIVSFVSTNLDDIFVLTIFFSQIGSKVKKTDVVFGQYLGIGLLVLISIIASYGLSFFSSDKLGLLGFIPIILGIKSLIDHKKESKNAVSSEDDKERVETQITVDNVGNKNILTGIIRPQILKVMFVTIANGADNIGIYIPLFSRYSLGQLVITIIIFSIMIAFWCFLGYKLANFPFIKRQLEKYKHIAIPLVFIALGLYIIFESGLIS